MEANNAFTIHALMQTVAQMQESITNLTRQLTAKKRHDLPGTPKMDLKDQKDPTAFSGQNSTSWSEDFVTHLTMRDRRWQALLKGIKERSKAPVSEMDGPKLMEEANISSNEILQTFQAQLYVYLKRFTTGEPLSFVLANRQERGL